MWWACVVLSGIYFPWYSDFIISQARALNNQNLSWHPLVGLECVIAGPAVHAHWWRGGGWCSIAFPYDFHPYPAPPRGKSASPRASLLGNNHMGGSERKERRACIIYLPYLLVFATLASLLKCPDRDGHGDFIPTPSGHSPHPPTRKSPGGSSRILLTWEISLGLGEIWF